MLRLEKVLPFALIILCPTYDDNIENCGRKHKFWEVGVVDGFQSQGSSIVEQMPWINRIKF